MDNLRPGFGGGEAPYSIRLNRRIRFYFNVIRLLSDTLSDVVAFSGFPYLISRKLNFRKSMKKRHLRFPDKRRLVEAAGAGLRQELTQRKTLWHYATCKKDDEVHL